MPDPRGSGSTLGRPFRSVRVRITLAAVVVTAVAVTAAGWLLVRSVEDTQLGRLRDDTGAYLDRVADQLENGADPSQAVLPPPGEANTLVSGPVVVQVVDGGGRTVAAVPTLSAGPGELAISLRTSGSDTFVGSQGSAAVPGQPPDTGATTQETVPEALGGTAGGIGAGEAEGSTGSIPPSGAGESTKSTPAIRPDDTVPGDGDLSNLDVRMIRADAVFSQQLEPIVRQVDTPSGALTVYAAAPVDEVARSVDAIRGALWMGLPVLVALVALVAWHLVGRALRPVEAIRSEVAAIGGATMHRRVPTPATDDEIGRLAHTMNAMLGRLEESATRQRQFVSDASHELRSPVTAIRADLEVALSEGDDADWPTVAREVLAEESRLEALLADLLILASTDEGASVPPGARVDVAGLAQAEAARPHRVPVAAEVDDPAPVAGSEGQLARVVTNLVDNAARHASSTVRVSVMPVPMPVPVTPVPITPVPVMPAPGSDGARWWRLTVDDDGPGIPASDRERVFERFTRLDDGRVRDAGGAGLGLAVVRSIVARHGGRVGATDSPLGGARLVVELPGVRAAP